IHQISSEDYYRVRTSRNQGLIEPHDQRTLAAAHVAVLGLSVGSSIATALAMEGVRSFYVSDMDRLCVSNLNRLQSRLQDVSRSKVDLVAERLWAIDPFCRIEGSRDGYN